MSVLHSTLTGADLHEPKPHAASHDAGGADEISTLGDVVVQSLQVQDSKALILGTGGDATILYDGTDLIIDPQVVGAGAVEVQSILRIVAPDNNAVMELVVNDESQRWRFQARETDGAFFVRDQTAGTLPFLIEAGAPTDTLKLYSTGDVSIEATAKLFLDGGGNSYILEASADNVQIVAGGAGAANFSATAVTMIAPLRLAGDNRKAFFGTGDDATIYYDGTNLVVDPAEVGSGRVDINDGDLSIDPTKRLYLDGGGDTYIHEGGANAVQVVCGGGGVATFTSAGMKVNLDNQKLILGTGSDATLYYDGTNLVIDPAEVGSGRVDINGGDLSLDVAQRLFIGDTADANVTTGITINNGTSGNPVFAGKRTDVAHGLTSIAETDTCFNFGPIDERGGFQLSSFAEDDTNRQFVALYTTRGGEANTLKTTGATGLHWFLSYEHNGAGSLADITANGNVFTIGARVGGATRALFIVDEDGDYHYDGADGGAFDEFDDAQLVRAFSLVTSRDPIRTEWDRFVEYGEAELVATGILGDTIENGGLVNGAQLQRLHTGAIWQMYTLLQEQAAQIADLKQRLLQGAG
jgi:hypothetical protein